MTKRYAFFAVIATLLVVGIVVAISTPGPDVGRAGGVEEEPQAHHDPGDGVERSNGPSNREDLGAAAALLKGAAEVANNADPASIDAGGDRQEVLPATPDGVREAYMQLYPRWAECDKTWESACGETRGTVSMNVYLFASGDGNGRLAVKDTWGDVGCSQLVKCVEEAVAELVFTKPEKTVGFEMEAEFR